MLIMRHVLALTKTETGTQAYITVESVANLLGVHVAEWQRDDCKYI
jgi:hypothetical protein